MRRFEAFDGERSTTHRKDEFPDVCATGFNYLMKAKSHTPPALPDFDSPTISAGIMGNIDDSWLF